MRTMRKMRKLQVEMEVEMELAMHWQMKLEQKTTTRFHGTPLNRLLLFFVKTTTKNLKNVS
mgnify:CR=1 FL=1